MAVLSIVDHLESLGLGNAREIYVYGHSSGGQFTGRFTWAHPHRVAAAFISAPLSHSFPDEYVRYAFGIGPYYGRLAPEGVVLSANVGQFLDTRLIFRVGEHDRDVLHPDFKRYPIAVHQGFTRIHRVLNMHEALSDVAHSTGRHSALLDHQVLLMEGIGHFTGINPVHTARFYRMMFAPKVEPNVFVHSRFVSEPTAEPSRATLPGHVEQWQPGDTLYLELWLNTSSPAGIASGTTDLFIDSEVLTPISITHGALFPESRSGQIDVGSNYVRNVAGVAIESGVGSDAFAMLARIEVLVDGEGTLRQLAALPQSGAWMLADGIPGTARTLPLPYAERTVLGGEDLFGQVFDDRNLDGTLNPHEVGLADRTVRLLDQEGADLMVPYRIAAADFGQAAMISKTIPEVTLTAVGGGSLGVSVYARDRDVAGTPTRFFCVATMTPYAYWWDERNGFELRADFASPVWQVDVRAHGGSGFSQARMRAYDADGSMIAESFSGDLAGSATETFGVTAASPEIAYVIVTGVNSGVRLDELTFVSSVHAQTDEHGHFEFRDVPAGTYRVAVDLPAGWNLIRPIHDGNPLHVGDDARRLLVGGAVSDNLAPAITGLTAAPDPVFRSSEFTLTAAGVSDPDGQVVRVEFYRDGQVLGADTDGSDGWSLSVDTNGWALGQHPLSARVQDNDGAWSEPVSTTVTVQNAPPTVDALTVAPKPVTRPGAITLTAQGVNDPDGTVVRVEFYRDTISPENLLGTVNSDGPWVLSGVSTAGWQWGVRQLWVRAQDDDGAWSEPVHTTVTIQNALPTIDALTANPNPVTRPGTILLSTSGVNDPDGSVARVAFYRGSINDEMLLGMVEGGEPWVLSGVSTADWQPGSHTLFARAQDNDGMWGLPVNTSLTVLNAAPTIQTLVVSPESLTRPGEISLTAQGVSDPDGTVQRVEFYRETISPATLLGIVEANGPWDLTGVSTEGWDAGRNILLARAQDNDGAWSSAASTTVTVENIRPQLNGLQVSPDPVTRPGQLTLLTEGVNDPDGMVLRVEFYRGTISDDTRLGTVEANGPWLLLGVSSAGWDLGQQTLLARAQDDDGAWSDPISTTVTVQNAVPSIAALAVAPDPVTRPGELTLTAEGVSDPDGTVVRVEFYRGTISDDTRLGTVEANGPWVLTGVSSAGWPPGQQTLLARAQDDDGAWSAAVSTTVTIQNAVPTIDALAVNPAPITRPAELTLTAEGVNDPDGHVVRVEFYRGDDLLGTDEEGGDDWSWTGSTDGWEPGEHTFSARAEDNDGAWSQMASTTATIANAVPVVASLSADADSVTRPGALTLTANGVEDPDGQVVRVEFYREAQLLGESDGSDGWTWTGLTTGWTLGATAFHARARDDDGAWSGWVSTTVTVVNAVPEIGSLLASPDPVTRPGHLTLSASDVFDPDGHVVRVEFYRGEELLGESDGSDGWTWSGGTAGWDVGEQVFYARAQDNDGAWSEPVSTTATIANAVPVIESLSADPDPVPRSSILTLSSLEVADPDGQVTQVEFYHGDQRLGESDGSDGWAWTVDTTGWALGETTFHARARDNDGAWSEWASATVTVVNAVSEIGSFSATPDSVTRSGQLTLTAADVFDPDGHVVRVEFYRGEELLGESDGADGWTWTVSTAGWDLGEHTLLARAQDDDGAWSDTVSTTVTVQNAVPTIEALAVAPDPVTRPGELTLTAEGVNDLDGTVVRVEFYRGTISDDMRLGTVEANGPWVLAGVSTAGWDLGQQTLLARVQDDDGAWSDSVSTTVRIQNAVPTIEALVVAPDPVTRPDQITLTAEGVNDPDGTVVRVEFYRGTISDDTRLGTVEANAPWVLTAVSTAGWDLGEQTLLARAQDDDDAWSVAVSTTVTIQNAVPIIEALAVNPDPVTRPDELILTAEGVHDPDGTVIRVEFYRGTISDDTRLGTVEANGPWVLAGVTTAGWDLGEQTLLARAQDDDGAWSEAVSTTVTIQNAVPSIEALAVAPDPITRPGELTLTAEGVHDPDGTVVRVEFYRGAISDDTRLGTVEANGPWVLAGVSTAGWDLGEQTLLARAQDDDGAWSAAVSTTVTVQNAVPTIEALAVNPDPVTRPDELTLTAEGVNDPDGTVIRVEFYRDSTLLGTAEDGSDAWNLTVSTAGWTLGEHTFSARAIDDDHAASELVSATVTVQNAFPGLASLSAVPASVVRPDQITLAAAGAYDPDGTVVQVAFHRGDVLLGVDEDGSDGWSWTGDTADWPGGEQVLSACAQDNDGTWGEAVSTTASVYAELPPVDFGVLPVWATQQRSFTVHNDGTGPLLVQASDLDPPFAVRPADEPWSDDDWIVAIGATATFVISYSPIDDGSHRAALTLTGAADGRVVHVSGRAASGWQNPVHPFDINGDGFVTPQDVLLLINEINRNGSGTLPPRTAQQPGPPYFLDPNGDGDLTPNDVLQVINFINRGGTEEEPAGESAEVEAEPPDGDRALSVHYGWLTAMDAAGSLMPVIWAVPSAVSGSGGDVRADHLMAAVEEVAFRTTYRQPGMGDWADTCQRWEPSRDAGLAAATGDDLADWETLLDDPATDLTELDAYFAALAE